MEYNIHYPDRKEQAPCVIIAPGRKLHKDSNIIVEIADHMSKQGWVVIRFNWSFYTNNTSSPYEGMDAFPEQLEDVTKVILIAQNDARVQKDNISLLGKCLGSIVAWHYMQHIEDHEIKSIILLTPIFKTKELIDVYYPTIKELKVPILIIVGNNDEMNCKLPLLYKFFAEKPSFAEICVIDGDHLLEVFDYKNDIDDQKTKQNYQVLKLRLMNFLDNTIDIS